ncbi:uncharacterized protein LOC100374614 isoform X2 [Saccoglossus kowalevskii]|uniref:Uncharacterized protein LOC100374614 n=1 Tax=Saccoglossus kowalevskii TaxID=10224 RepID=A0ABM0GLK2_SACKO|nr:PREDICTED: uncharacterized protein LOC100374614 [Saccoglossus kowalevskii]
MLGDKKRTVPCVVMENLPCYNYCTDSKETCVTNPLYDLFCINSLERLSIKSLGDEFSNKLKTASSPTAVDKVIEEYSGKTICVGGNTLFVHTGLPDALETIAWDFEKVYVGKPLHMLGYLHMIDSEYFVLLDDNGNVYQADDAILHWVSKDVVKYFRSGPENLGFYDYYDYLDSSRSLPCVGGSHDNELNYLEENKKIFEKKSEQHGEIKSSMSETELKEYTEKSNYYANLLIPPCN